VARKGRIGVPQEIRRGVALGASNLTRGFHTVVATARATSGPRVEVLAALGHGRSYGLHSRLAVRTLPGILRSGLWDRLEALPPAPTQGLVTDVGNDVLYGQPADQIVAWVDEAVARMQRVTQDIVLTDLPLASVQRLSPAAFLAFRSILVPQCRLSLAEVLDTAARVNDGLEAIAAARGVHFFGLKPDWYGIDPIHIRPALWKLAWQEILCGTPCGRHPDAIGSKGEALRLYLLRPERQWMFGREQFTAQHGVSLPRGGRVWLY
jgi:hypothetical protein